MKLLKRFGILLALLIIILLSIGCIYQNSKSKKDVKNYHPVGSIYEIKNKKMHIYTGGNGDATVVFAAGWGTVNPYIDFYPLYDGVSKFAKFAVYDRFGYGYSDFTDEKRDVDSVVDEVHELLIKSEQRPPYILVGHSLASVETIRFAQKYKDEVKGIVLIDGGNPEMYASQKPATFIASFQRQLIKFGIARILYNTEGFADSVNSERNNLKLIPEELKEVDKISTLLRGSNRNIIDEMRMSQENAKKVCEGDKLGSIPLTIITAGSFEKQNSDWLESQKKLKEWSENSKQFVVENAQHYIHQYKPDIIIKEIEEIAKKMK
ncbi:alpha/beta hydrolase family protein [Clostridium homopropionicum DSM 5847]|uniref:Alpha/beta hydrolase family protein n=1 Tax=Clostridium homopropionicum DSM 5847 TaxID=1121318 RepID=A0A0L6Z6U5_9CLOT|nr:alpha/beta hydrolase [Clostridium homopropionicum]KOA18558.1 alpha/beta hydrolase family protein [Clostridium homopropionicum DSM 5847]SFF64843.1 Pimeloyl-ACP methyl ester carboxylesterase [Clostridium homopropionicum]